jgi:serine/threonine protein kinase/TPR repeat protein
MPDTTEFDHYEVLRREDGTLFELGRGAMGITYKAFDTNLRCPVALKVINAASIHSDVARQRFVREARSAAQLRHRHVASVFHLGVEGDTYFYAMEFIEGETVESLVRRRGPLEPILALRIAVQVARALNAAQKHQLVHRDIKPSNLMLVREDEELVVKVIDFGLAKSRRGEDSTGEVSLSGGGFVGTPHFASPEQLEELDLDIRSDIYSLGVTLWYMLTGEPPFHGTLAQVMSRHLHSAPPVDRIASLPEPVRDIVGRMLAKKPAQRPQDAAELRASLEACIETLSASQPSGTVDPSAQVVLVPESGATTEALLKSKGFYAGALVGSRYELLRDLGESNCGWAFQAEDLHDSSRLRLLVLQAEWASDPAALTQIEREVEKLRSLEHPNILRVLGIERTPDAGYILLEWIEGFSLLELLRCRQEIDADETLLLLRQIAAGVDEATARGFRHLDFSLNQIFVHFFEPEKEPGRRLAIPVDRWPRFLVKVNPLGITRDFATSDTWAGGQTLVGEFTAAPPRDLAGAPAGQAIQSLAAVVYELLGGAAGGQQVSRYIPVAALPEAGNTVLKKALDPRSGYASAADFRMALEGALAGDYRAELAPSIAAGPARAAAAPAPPAPTEGRIGPIVPIGPITPKPPPPSLKPSARIPWLALTALSACTLAALGLWLMNRPASEPQSIAGAPTATPLPATELPAETPPPVSTPPPAPDPNALMTAKLREGEGYESAQDWPRAVESYVEFTGSFPGVEAGRIHLETLLSSLRPTLDKMPADQFAGLLPAITAAATQGSVAAMVILGGHLRSESPTDAFAWYCAAAQRGDASAMTQAGLMVSNGAGVPQDDAKAAMWFQIAANAGDPAGKTCLAECYLHGTGVGRDERQAIDLLEEAVGAGDPRAMNLLGTCFHQGVGGPKNYAGAFKLFSQARDLGFQDAAGNLGVLYMNGDGVPRDSHKAVNLFAEGAQNGSPYCMYLLAKCLEYGTGINANQFQAEAWYCKAAAGGNPMALDWCKSNRITVEKPSP